MPRVDMLVATAAALGVSIDQLVTGEETLIQSLVQQAVAEVRREYDDQIRDLRGRLDEISGPQPHE